MKKRTIIIVSISLVLALIAIAVIATFPTYLLEDNTSDIVSDPSIQSGNITEHPDNEDGGVVGGVGGGVQAVLPGIDIGVNNSSTVTQPNSNLKELAQEGGATLLAENGAFSKDAKSNIKKLGIFNKKYYRARHYIRDFSKNFTVYEVTVEKDGKVQYPVGAAKLVIEIPEKYNLNNVEIYYMLSDGGVQKLNCQISDNKTATINFIESGVYILVERKQPEATDSPSSDTSTGEQDNNSSVTSNTSSNTDSSNSSTDSSDVTSSNPDTSSGSSSTESDPNKETMDGWTPWY